MLTQTTASSSSEDEERFDSLIGCEKQRCRRSKSAGSEQRESREQGSRLAGSERPGSRMAGSYPPRVLVSRPALTSEQFSDLYHELEPEKSNQLEAVWRASRPDCSNLSPFSFLLSFLAVTSWLPRYNWRKDLPSDLVAGFTVAVMHIPQGMAYGMLAGVDPVIGIYTAFFPVLVYVMLGTMSHVSMGTFAVVSILVSKPVVHYSGVGEGEYSRLEVATAVTFCVGVVQFVMGLVRLGSLTVVLTDVLVSAFTVGASFHVLTSQVKHVLGLMLPTISGSGRLVRTYIMLGNQMPDVNPITLTISLCCLTVLVTAEQVLAPRLKRKCRFPLPTQLGLVVFFTLLSSPLQLATVHKVRTIQDIGSIPVGLPFPQLPPPSLLPQVFLDSLPVAVVAFVIGQGLGSMFGEKYGYKVPANQELVAQGLSNLVGSMFSCLPMAGSLSRSLVQEASGCRSQVTSLVSALLLLTVLLSLGPLFQPLPVCVLASIILSSLVGILRKVQDITRFWSRSNWDGFLWLVTFLTTVFADVDIGLIVGVVVSLLLTLIRNFLPSVVVLQNQGEVWLDRSRFPTSLLRGRQRVVQVKGPLNFLTVGLVKQLITEELKFQHQPHPKQEETESLLRRPISEHTCLEVDTVRDLELRLGGEEEEEQMVSGRGADVLSDSEEVDIEVGREVRQDLVLDLSLATGLDSGGCGLVGWVGRKVEEEGGEMGLVAKGEVLGVLERHKVLDTLECQVFPDYLDAVTMMSPSSKFRSEMTMRVKSRTRSNKSCL